MNYYIFKSATLTKKDNSLELQTQDEKIDIPIFSIRSIHIFANVNISTTTLDFLNKNKINIYFYNHITGKYIGCYEYSSFCSTNLIAQVNAYNNKRILIIRKIYNATFHNIIKVLSYKNNKNVFSKEINEIKTLTGNISYVNDYFSLLCLEGQIRKIYYSCFDNIINNEDFIFSKRSKHPPKNYLNALISFLNALLYNTCHNKLIESGLNPQIGYLHATNKRNNSLALDISEIFKPILVDKIIFRLIHLKIITKEDFMIQNGGTYINNNGKIKVIKEYHKKLETSIKYGKKNQKYQQIILLDIYKLKKYIIEEKEFKFYESEW